MSSKAHSFFSWGAFIGTPILQSLAKTTLPVARGTPTDTGTLQPTPLSASLSPQGSWRTAVPRARPLPQNFLCCTGGAQPRPAYTPGARAAPRATLILSSAACARTDRQGPPPCSPKARGHRHSFLSSPLDWKSKLLPLLPTWDVGRTNHQVLTIFPKGVLLLFPYTLGVDDKLMLIE